MSLLVPIRAIPNQQVQAQLGGQACTVNIFQQAAGLYVDLYVGSSPVALGVIALNLNRIVRYRYLGFAGDLTFWDTQGTEDPVYTGLGARFQLVYIEAGERAFDD